MARLQGVGNVKGTVKQVLIGITASDGIVGWGEGAPWEVFTGTAEGAFAALDIYLRPVIIGKPVRRIRSLMAELDKVLVGHMEAKVAGEMAMLDIVGKGAGLSVADLIGGRVRDRIPISFSIADPDFAADLDRMRAMVPTGNVIYKVKRLVLRPRCRASHCPTYLHAISLVAAVGVAYAILRHMVAVARPISGKTLPIDFFGPGLLVSPASAPGCNLAFLRGLRWATGLCGISRSSAAQFKTGCWSRSRLSRSGSSYRGA